MNNKSLNLNLKLTINQMLMSNVHVGHTRRFLNVKIKPYLLGYRNNIYILNISHTTAQFKIFINILMNLISVRQKLLIVRDRDVFNFRDSLNLKNVYYYDKKWIGGALTNFKKVRHSKIFKANNNFYTGLGSMRYMPSLVFFFDSNLSKWALIETSNLEIPIVSIVDTNINLFSHINYPIVGNNKAFESMYLYLNLIRNAVLKGRQKELLKILRIV